ncbi:GNAT family N-acetyltransferase [Hahella ganghwensis]|uniref:GNAT family N-acetyltransferase n=1 Tax=Hahella ganghwensis TaxID=286420 RepID=UPI00035E6B7B|nr:GNAT family N-acetyltransferase [Hahella ganghwensis]
MASTTLTEIKIRTASTKDAGTVAELAAQLYSELDLHGQEQIDQTKLTNTAQTLLDGHRIVAFIAEEDGIPVGLITLHRCAALYAGGEFGEISELYVTRDHRKLGIGQGLLAAASRYASSQGWERLELGAPAGSRWDNTFSFYEDYGFAAIGPRLRLLLN